MLNPYLFFFMTDLAQLTFDTKRNVFSFILPEKSDIGVSYAS